MKKFLLLLVISSGLFVNAKAQSKFSIGPNAGVGMSWISNDGDAKAKLAGNVGLSTVYSATEHFGLGLDLKYSFEGVKSKTDNSSLDMNYVRIPLKAIYFFNGYGDKLRPKIAIGPSFGFLTSAKAKDGSGPSVDVKEIFNSFDLGVTAAAGLNYKLVSNTWLNLDVSYLHGISDIIKNNTSGSDASHNRNIQLNVGVNFGL